MSLPTVELRHHLTQKFGDAELVAFCQDHFLEVYDTFGRGMGKDEKINRLLDYCLRNRASYQTLLDKSGIVEAAQQKLADLPLDTIPAPASLPFGSRMPLRANPLFVGREADLRHLAQVLKVGDTAAIGQIAAATGLGGIGKTQLASEFVHRYGQYFAGGVFWLSFADPASIPTEIATCLPPGEANFELEVQLRLVLSAWQSDVPRLLIFDNCEDESLLAQWRPSSGGCRVLITSRRATWSKTLGVQAMPLDVLNRAESLALLRKHRPDLREDDPALDAIAGELGDLPLALHLAGSYLETYAADPLLGDPTTFLAELRDDQLLEHPALQGEAVTISPTDYHTLHAGRMFALSYERLDPAEPVDEVARNLLARAACFAPGEPIPRELLLATLQLADDDRPGRKTAAQGLNRLLGLGLLTPEDENALSLHRLPVAFMAQTEPEIVDEARTAVEVTLLVEAFGIIEVGYPAPLLAWQPHLRAVTDVAQARGDEQAAALCLELGKHLSMVAEYEAARIYYERTLDICRNMLGEEHPATAHTLNDLGLLLEAMGDYEAALPYLERALAIARKVLGKEHPATASSLNNLGFLLDTMGEYEAAQLYYERALAIHRKVFGEEHPTTATSLNNLGALLDTMGDYKAAQPYYERALAIRRRVWGEEHPDTANSLNNLGGLLKEMGETEAARPYYEQALVIRQKVLGEEHPDTATSLNNLGLLLEVMGDYEVAQPYLEQALTIRRNVLGEMHPATAGSLNNLGLLLRVMGEAEAARPHLEQALTIHQKVLGEEHPDTAQILDNLGTLLDMLGETEAARSYLEQALAICQNVLGEAHPDTARSLNNLGGLLYTIGEYEEAQPYYERALAICEATLGPDHPYTQKVQNNLAALKRELEE